SAHAAAHCIFLQARLQCGSQTGSLKLRRYHKGHLSEIGRRAQEVAGAANDLLVLARSSDGEESDLGLVVYVAQRLEVPVGQRAQAPKEPRIDVVLRKAMEQSLQRSSVGRA